MLNGHKMVCSKPYNFGFELMEAFLNIFYSQYKTLVLSETVLCLSLKIKKKCHLNLLNICFITFESCYAFVLENISSIIRMHLWRHLYDCHLQIFPQTYRSPYWKEYIQDLISYLRLSLGQLFFVLLFWFLKHVISTVAFPVMHIVILATLD